MTHAHPRVETLAGRARVLRWRLRAVLRAVLAAIGVRW